MGTEQTGLGRTVQDKTVKDCVWPVYEYRADKTWQLGQDKTRL